MECWLPYRVCHRVVHMRHRQCRRVGHVSEAFVAEAPTYAAYVMEQRVSPYWSSLVVV